MTADDKPRQLLRLSEVLELTTLSKTQLHLMRSKGLFPEPIDLGSRRVAWDPRAINEWIESRGMPADSSTEKSCRALEKIAQVCHEVNRAYCQALGDYTHLPWAEAPEWQRDSARMGAKVHTEGNFGAEASHAAWLKAKTDEGWVYGPIKNPLLKQHPCMVPFCDLPPEQQAKDFIFRAIVHALRETAPVGPT